MGMSRSSGSIGWGDGTSLDTMDDDPHVVVDLPPGMSEAEFMRRIKEYKDWNRWLWLPWMNDCHNQLERAFEHAGVQYPGAPNGRVDIDDNAFTKLPPGRDPLPPLVRKLAQVVFTPVAILDQ